MLKAELNFELKVLANEDTLLRTHCCRHKCFPVCPRAQHLLRIQILCPGHKNVSDFVQKHFVSATNVSQFARARKRHEQQCFRNNVSSFVSTLILYITIFVLESPGSCFKSAICIQNSLESMPIVLFSPRLKEGKLIHQKGLRAPFTLVFRSEAT